MCDDLRVPDERCPDRGRDPVDLGVRLLVEVAAVSVDHLYGFERFIVQSDWRG